MINRHAEIRKLLAVYDGLAAVERRAVDSHVKECSACASKMVAYTQMDARMAGLADPIPPASLARALDTILRGAPPMPRKPEAGMDRRWFPQRVLLPAGLVLVLFLGVWLMMQLSTPLDHGVAQTPSVTPTRTPVALASPLIPTEIASAELLNWLTTRDPVPLASGKRDVSSAASEPRLSAIPAMSTVIAYR